ncbi:hypothetical protein OK016_19110 [Vibrio chagasii]|nr:hypothetical protein [Vibrio chagasii]
MKSIPSLLSYSVSYKRSMSATAEPGIMSLLYTNVGMHVYSFDNGSPLLSGAMIDSR